MDGWQKGWMSELSVGYVDKIVYEWMSEWMNVWMKE